MSESYLRNVIEAALLAAGRPLQREELKQLFDESARPSDGGLAEILDALSGEYAGRGIELKETASGLRIQVRREFAAEVSRLWPERPARYSRALLETLALIAYRQPITRGEIEDVRGVAVNPGIIKTLLERNWVRVVGQRDVPGRPELLGTTREFLDYFGLVSLDQLPPLSELKALGDLNLQLDLHSGADSQSATPGETAAPAQEGNDDGSAIAATVAPPGAASETETGQSAGEPGLAEQGSPDEPDEPAGAGEAFEGEEVPPREMCATPFEAD